VNVKVNGKQFNLMNTLAIFNPVHPPAEAEKVRPQGDAGNIALVDFVGGDYATIQSELRLAFTTMVVDWWVEHVPRFKHFDKLRSKWPSHEYEAEQSQKSRYFGLGVWRLDEKKKEDMIELLERLMKYVPTWKVGDSIRVLYVLLGGDQMTRALLSGRQRDLAGEPTAHERCEGLIPQFLDLHGKFASLGAVWKLGYDAKSVAQSGTLAQLQKILRCKGVTDKPHQCFDDALELLVTAAKGAVKASTSMWLGKKGLRALPDRLRILSRKQPKKWTAKETEDGRTELARFAGEYVDEFVMPTFDFEEIFRECAARDEVQGNSSRSGPFPHHVAQPIPESNENQDLNQDQQPAAGGESGDPAVSISHVPEEDLGVDCDEEPSVLGQTSANQAADGVNNYVSTIMGCGLLLACFCMAISIGDGGRVCNLYYKILQLVFMRTGKRNYNLECIFLTCLTHAILPEATAHSLIWNRFANMYGVYGRCMSRDKLNEAGNRFCKQGTNNGGANRPEQMSRLSEAEAFMKTVVENLNTEIGVKRERLERRRHRSGVTDRTAKMVDTVARIFTDVQGKHAFEKVPGRKYEAFPHMTKSIFERMDAVMVVKNLEERRDRVAARQRLAFETGMTTAGTFVLPAYRG
jgi:hypothetical protein